MLPQSVWCLLIVATGLGFLLLGPAQADQNPSPEELNRARANLSHPEFAVREAATRQLWQHADLARDQLEAARASRDPEVQRRIRRITEAVRMGIRPDTPREVVEKIYTFHDGNLQEKRAIIGQLVSSGNLNTAFRLLRALENPSIQTQLASLLANQVRASLLPHLLNEEWDQAGALLRNAALGDLGMRDYASFLLHIQKLQAAIEALSQAPVQDPRLHTWLLRAAGRFNEALALAVAEDDASLQHELGAAHGDALAFCEAELTLPTINEFIRPAVTASKARLTGDQPGFDAAVNDLFNLAKNPDLAYAQRFAVSALLLNDLADRLLAEVPDLDVQIAYDIQTYRGLYADALKRWGVKEMRPPYDDWLTERCEAIAKNQDARGEVLQEIFDLAAHVLDMGEESEAARMLDEAFQAAKSDLRKRRSLVTEEMRLGLRAQAEKHLKALSDAGTRIDQLKELLPYRNELVDQWHAFFSQQMGDEAPVDRLVPLIQTWKLLDPDDEPGKKDPPAEVLEILEAAHREGESLEAETKEAEAREVEARRAGALNAKEGEAAQLKIKAQTYLDHLTLAASVQGADEHALRYLEELAALADDAATWQRLGQALMKEEAWDRAAQAHEKAWKAHCQEVRESAAAGLAISTNLGGGPSNPTSLQPTFLYFAAVAHREGGRTDKAAALTTKARLLCLGDLGARFKLAAAMDRHGDESLALEEWDLITRLSLPQEPEGTWSFYHLAEPASKTDPLKGIAYLERVAAARHRLGVTSQAEFTFNLRLRSLCHLWSAKASVLQEDTPAALEALQRYWKLTPGNASIGEELLPLIEEAGEPEKAREYYEKTRALALEACQVFPNSAMVHNNLAWLDARSRRHLDEALEHAETALKLKPNTAAYLDTLAEVHFAMGDRAKALDLSAKAVELTPLDKELLGQRKRFESAPLPEKRPPSE